MVRQRAATPCRQHPWAAVVKARADEDLGTVEEQDAEKRGRALEVWRMVIGRMGVYSSLYIQMRDAEDRGRAERSLTSAFTGKATSTIASRGSAWSLYLRHVAARSPRPPFPISEEKLFN